MSAFTSAAGLQPVQLRRVYMAIFWTLLAVALAKSVSEFMPTMLDLMWDKAQHFTAFATLTALAVLAWPGMSSLRVFERMALLGAMIEVVQATPSLQRGCDVLDWTADMVAVSVVLGVRWLARRQKSG
jgi:hypothetical protein